MANSQALKKELEDLDSMQQTVNTASDDDKATLHAMLDRMQTNFDAGMEKPLHMKKDQKR